MNTRNLLFLVLLLAALLFIVPAVFAQETPVPTAEAMPPPVDTTTTTTTTTTATPFENIGLTLTWVIAFVTLWQAAGIAYAVTVEKSIKPMIYSILTEDAPLRRGILIVAVFIGAIVAVYSGGVNLFADAPFGLFTDASPLFMQVLNSVFVAAGAFMGHEIWQTLETWLRKFKAVSDVLTSPPPITAQARRYNPGAPADGEDR